MGAPLDTLLSGVYGDQAGAELCRRLRELTSSPGFAGLSAHKASALTQRDALLISYADQVSHPGESPLRTLGGLLDRHVEETIPHLHLLPFYPWTSDDGFSVVDFTRVAEENGSWEDIDSLARRRGLMFDAVFNHMSAQSPWFLSFLKGDPAFADWFVTADECPELNKVVRPRTSPLLTPFDSSRGKLRVWTTFSADQVDLNIANPEVFFALARVLLLYASHGASFIRLDAIAYWWKELGTECIHHPHTHALIRALRAFLDEAAPNLRLITETNVPHRDNISYFGNGSDEAQLVYNFALPPLLINALQTGSAVELAAWASQLETPSKDCCFFNFIASHDGVGLNPARGILTPEAIAALVERCTQRGGLVSYKTDPNGGQSPYELNINLFDALSVPGEEETFSVRRFLTAHAVMLSLRGVPGIYFHSLFGSRGDPEGARVSGIKRRINREKSKLIALEAELGDPASRRSRVFQGLKRLFALRAQDPAFSPQMPQTVLPSPDSCLSILRGEPGKGPATLCLHNLGGDPLELAPRELLPQNAPHSIPSQLWLAPWDYLWLRLN